MRKQLTHAILAALVVCFAGPALADGNGNAGPDVAAPPVHAGPITAPPPSTAVGRTGQISLMNGDVLLNVPAGFKFYSAEQALAYLQRNNAQAPAGTVLGLIARSDANIQAPDTWATVVSYDGIGYVQAETASGLSDPNLEADVRSARQQQNKPFEGFAVQPSFDASAVNLAWGERVGPPGAGGGKDLRYEQKLLGRRGVATLTSIGAADQMPAIQTAAPRLMAMLSFPEGARHSDFQPATDQVSAYSVPALVTGVPAAQAQAVASPAATGTGQTGFGGLSGMFPWIALGVVVLAGLGFMLFRRRNANVADERVDDA